MDALIQGFLLDRKAYGVSPHTIQWHKTSLNSLREFLVGEGFSTTPTEWTKTTLKLFIVWLQERPNGKTGETMSETTVRTKCNSIWAFCRWLYDEGFIETNLAMEVKKPMLSHVRKQPYVEGDLKRLFDSVLNRQNSLRDTAILYLLLDTGLRSSEVCNLDVADLITDREGSILKIRQGKGKRDRENPVSPKAVMAITRYLVKIRGKDVKGGDPLFISQRKRRMCPSSVLTMVHRAAVRAGIDEAYVHKFRHTFAIYFLRNGGDPLTLQRILGHATLTMTNRYVEMVTDDLSRVHAKASPLTNLDRK